ncbi:hypothetical protein AL755_13310 [Arthrobacter sp. ERGS1:01]|uniref:hypothetical protein n=1 Tax=Arthrobacter sp. ERGS1:01 TaxID=1704044 RepID=UPI0006B45708|nr:hypothetical protein [Arthrobacter sp. ERGS1:01]ALE06216.1 hypothetical protein AL755_13310 [Arthrobacter sp. ERGS1:01]
MSTAITTNQEKGQLAAREVRHRLGVRREDRIRNFRDIGLAELPLQFYAGSELWCHVVMGAAETTSWPK